MEKKRIGKDIEIRWTILTSGEEKSLHGRDLRLCISSMYSSTLELPISISGDNGNIVGSIFRGVDQKRTGKYRLTLWENFGKDGQTAVDKCDAVELVSTTCEEGGEDANGLDIETIDLGTSNIEMGLPGAPGKSAYEIAVANGFVGSEEEWLKSLKGDVGDKPVLSADPDGTIRSDGEFLTDVIKVSAGVANDAAGRADEAAKAAYKAIGGYLDKYPYDLEVSARPGEKSNLYCEVRGFAENEDLSSLRIFLMRTLKRHRTGHSGDNGYYYKDVLGWRHPVHDQEYSEYDRKSLIFPDAQQITEFAVQRGEFLVGNILEICIKPFARYYFNSTQQKWYVRLGKNRIDSNMKGHPELSGVNKDYGLAVYKIADGVPIRVSKIAPFDISVHIKLEFISGKVMLNMLGTNIYSIR